MRGARPGVQLRPRHPLRRLQRCLQPPRQRPAEYFCLLQGTCGFRGCTMMMPVVARLHASQCGEMLPATPIC